LVVRLEPVPGVRERLCSGFCLCLFAPSRSHHMSFSLVNICVGAIAWSGLLLGSLSIARLPGDWGHAFCGPWGCGPSIQALVACHLSWLVVLLPAAFLFANSSRVSPELVRRVGTLLVLAAIIGLLTIVVYQRIIWLPAASDFQRPYFWQRCGFVIATSIDLPLLQVLLAGIALRFLPNHRARGAAKPSTK
jgi:putative copper export protein